MSTFSADGLFWWVDIDLQQISESHGQSRKSSRKAQVSSSVLPHAWSPDKYGTLVD